MRIYTCIMPAPLPPPPPRPAAWLSLYQPRFTQIQNVATPPEQEEGKKRFAAAKLKKKKKRLVISSGGNGMAIDEGGPTLNARQRELCRRCVWWWRRMPRHSCPEIARCDVMMLPASDPHPPHRPTAGGLPASWP